MRCFRMGHRATAGRARPIETPRASVRTPRGAASRRRSSRLGVACYVDALEPRTLFAALAFDAAPSLTLSGFGITNSIARDFNADGHTDLAVSKSGGSGFDVLIGVGDGTFAQPVEYKSFDKVPSWMACGDFNGDGKPDLALPDWATSEFTVRLGVGDGTFGAAVHHS